MSGRENVGQPKLTGESAGWSLPQGGTPGQAVVQDWRRGASPPKGQQPPAIRPFRGEGRLVSAAEVPLPHESLSPRRLVCPGAGLGRGHRCSGGQ